jgi:CheY-like chemotaxis protein
MKISPLHSGQSLPANVGGGPSTEKTNQPANFKPASPRRKILIVDDDRVILQTISSVLTKAGYEVLTKTDPTEAIAIFRDHQLDAILLDIHFPPDVAFGGGAGWDGLQLMQWLRRLKNSARTCFVIITCDDVASLKQSKDELPAAAFFQKPIDHQELLATLARELAG